MTKRILVPLDRSATAEEVLPLAAAIARGSGASVRLLVVSPEPDYLVNERGRVVAYIDQESARVEAECLDYLQTVAARLDGDCDVECAVRFGEPATEILREADASGADLIAVTTTGRSGVGRVVLGSVAEEVLRKAQEPVVLMRPSNHRH